MRYKIKTAGLYEAINKQRLDKEAWPGTINLPEFIEVEVESHTTPDTDKCCYYCVTGKECDGVCGNFRCICHQPKECTFNKEMEGGNCLQHPKLPQKIDLNFYNQPFRALQDKVNEILDYLASKEK